MLTFAESRNRLLCSTFVNIPLFKQQKIQIKWAHYMLVSMLGTENTTMNKTDSLIAHTSRKSSKHNTM